MDLWKILLIASLAWLVVVGVVSINRTVSEADASMTASSAGPRRTILLGFGVKDTSTVPVTTGTGITDAACAKAQIQSAWNEDRDLTAGDLLGWSGGTTVHVGVGVPTHAVIEAAYITPTADNAVDLLDDSLTLAVYFLPAGEPVGGGTGTVTPVRLGEFVMDQTTIDFTTMYIDLDHSAPAGGMVAMCVDAQSGSPASQGGNFNGGVIVSIP